MSMRAGSSSDRRPEAAFHISEWAYEIGIRGAYVCVDGGGPICCRTEALASHFQRAIRSAGERFAGRDAANDDVLRGFRLLHKAVGADRKMISSPENLIKIVQKRGTLPSIHPLVDLYNLVSLETQVALGAHDLARTPSPITLRQATGAEPFWPLGASEPVRVPVGEYAYIDGSSEIICRLEARQVEKTKVTAATTAAFVIIQASAVAGWDCISRALDIFTDLCREYLAARVDIVSLVK
jgi:DNA/RNA-binding domain of Phe-tRNA-synthetase-like protein